MGSFTKSNGCYDERNALSRDGQPKSRFRKVTEKVALTELFSGKVKWHLTLTLLAPHCWTKQPNCRCLLCILNSKHRFAIRKISSLSFAEDRLKKKKTWQVRCNPSELNNSSQSLKNHKKRDRPTYNFSMYKRKNLFAGKYPLLVYERSREDNLFPNPVSGVSSITTQRR